MMVMVVVMVVVITPPTMVVMMMMVVMIAEPLGHLNITLFGQFRLLVIDRLESCNRIRDRLQQLGE